MSFTERWFALNYWLAIIGIGTFLLFCLVTLIIAIRQDMEKAKEKKKEKGDHN